MNGKNSRPTDAVNTSSTATSLSLKKRSTRYLSRCTEMAHSTGPANAKTSQDMDDNRCSRHCERSEAIQGLVHRLLDCFVASLLAMTTLSTETSSLPSPDDPARARPVARTAGRRADR